MLRQPNTGIFAYPPTVEQAPSYQPSGPAPAASRGVIGTWLRNNLPAAMYPTGICSETGYPLNSAPQSARLLCGQVGTTSQYGANPCPIRAVGIVSPQSADCVQPGPAAAPRGGYRGLVIVALVIIGLWVFAGWTFREVAS